MQKDKVGMTKEKRIYIDMNRLLASENADSLQFNLIGYLLSLEYEDRDVAEESVKELHKCLETYKSNILCAAEPFVVVAGRDACKSLMTLMLSPFESLDASISQIGSMISFVNSYFKLENSQSEEFFMEKRREIMSDYEEALSHVELKYVMSDYEEALSHMELKYDFFDVVNNAKKHIFMVWEKESAQANGSYMVPAVDNGCRYYMLNEPVAEDDRQANRMSVLFHELGHCLMDKVCGGDDSLHGIMYKQLTGYDVCVSGCSEAEQSEVIADLLSIGFMHKSLFEKYIPYTGENAISYEVREMLADAVEALLGYCCELGED